MISLRTMKHVATGRTIRSFRSCRTLNRTAQNLIADQGRMMMGSAEALTKDAQRKWLALQWQARR